MQRPIHAPILTASDDCKGGACDASAADGGRGFGGSVGVGDDGAGTSDSLSSCRSISVFKFVHILASFCWT